MFLTWPAKCYMTRPLTHVSDLIFHLFLDHSTPATLALCLLHLPATGPLALRPSAKTLSSEDMVPLLTPSGSRLRSPSQRGLPEPPKITNPPHTLFPTLFLFIPKITYLFFPFHLEYKLHKTETWSSSLLQECELHYRLCQTNTC